MKTLPTPSNPLSQLFCWTIAGLALFGLGTTAAWAGPSFDQAVREAYQSDPAECIQLCEELLSDPAVNEDDSIRLLLYQARAHHLEKRPAEVTRTLERVRAVSPEYELDGVEHRVLWRSYLDVFGAALEPRGDLSTVAVFDFKNCVPGKAHDDWDGLGTIFSRKLQASLSAATNLRLVERERIQHILDEFEITDLQHEKTRVRIGKMVGAQVMVFGEFSKLDKDIVLMARVVETETTRILGDAEQLSRGGPSKALQSVEKLAEELGSHVNAEIESGADSSSNLREAWEEYGRGLDLLYNGDEFGAYEAIAAAVDADPNFVQAKTILRQLQGEGFASKASQ